MKRREICRILLLLYIGIIFCVLFLRSGYKTDNPILYWGYIERNIQIIPMKTVGEMINLITDPVASTLARRLAGANIIGNIFMLLPVGILVPLSSKSEINFNKFVFWSTISVLFMEVIQLISLKGSFDIDDILLNTTGLATGYFFYKSCCSKRN